MHKKTAARQQLLLAWMNIKVHIFFQKEPFCSEEEAKQMKRSIYEAAMEKVDFFILEC